MKMAKYIAPLFLFTVGAADLTSANVQNPNVEDDHALTCKISGDDLEKRKKAFNQLLKQCEEVSETEYGYSLRFPGNYEWTTRLVALIKSERVCCNFFKFELTFEPNLGPIRLYVGGSPKIKAFIDTEMNLSQDKCDSLFNRAK